MFRRIKRRKIKCLSSFNTLKLSKLLAGIAIAYTLSLAPAFSEQIIVDGKTNTTLNIINNTTTVNTSTIKGNNAFNSFIKFNVSKGKIVNLIVPDSCSGLINLIHNEATQIEGILNSIKNDHIGGNIFLVNPHGITVGPQGIVNVGSLTAVTPTTDFMNGFFKAPGLIDDISLENLLNSNIPINPNALINIEGKINAITDVKMDAGSIYHTGEMYTGAKYQENNIDLGDIVNLNTLEDGADIAVNSGNVIITAIKDFVSSGKIVADGGKNINAGDISIIAGNNIEVNSGSLISAKGKGEYSNAGDIYLFANNDSIFNQGAVIDARGGEISGDGGFIEFSAKDQINLAGGLFKAKSYNGQNGSVLIDPAGTTISSNQFTDGADYNIVSDSIIVNTGIIISTRDIANPATGNHLTDASTGNSGALTLTAPTITLESGSQLISFADGAFTGGAITLQSNIDGNPAPTSSSINIDGALLNGESITIKANVSITDTENLLVALSTANPTANILIDNTSTLTADSGITIISTATGIATSTATGSDSAFGAAIATAIANPEAAIEIDNGSTLTSTTGNINITSTAISEAISNATAGQKGSDSSSTDGKSNIDDAKTDGYADDNIDEISVAGAVAISASTPKASVNIGLNTSLQTVTSGDINISSTATSKYNAIADTSAVSSDTGVAASVAIAYSSPESNSVISDKSVVISKNNISISARSNSDVKDALDPNYEINAKATSGVKGSAINFAATTASSKSTPSATVVIGSLTAPAAVDATKKVNAEGNIILTSTNYGKAFSKAASSSEESSTVGIGGAVAVSYAKPITLAYINSLNEVKTTSGNIELTAGAGENAGVINDIAEASAIAEAGASGAKSKDDGGTTGNKAITDAKDSSKPDDEEASSGVPLAEVSGAVSVTQAHPVSKAYFDINTTVESGGSLELSADAKTKYLASADGQANEDPDSPAAAGIVTGVAIALSSPEVETSIPSTSNTTVSNNITLTSTGSTNNIDGTNQNAIAKAGASGARVGIAAAVANANSFPTVTASLASSSNINISGDVIINAFDHAKAIAEADGTTKESSTVGVGGAVAIANATPNTTALINSTNNVTADNITLYAGAGLDGSTINTIAEVSAITVAGASGAAPDGNSGKSAVDEAKGDGSTPDDKKASSGVPVVEVAGAVSVAQAHPESKAYFDSNTDITATGTIDISADAKTTYNSSADSSAVDGGTVAIGVGVAIALSSPDAEAYIPTDSTLNTAGAINLSATADANTASGIDTNALAKAGASGSKVDIAAAVANANAYPTANAYLGSASILNVTNDITINSYNHAKAIAEAEGSTKESSIVGISGSVAVANATPTTNAYINSTNHISAGNITLYAGAGLDGSTINDIAEVSSTSTAGSTGAASDGNSGKAATDEAKGDGSTPDDKKASSGVPVVEVAGAVSVAQAHPESKAYFDSNTDITASGAIDISADAKTTYNAIADSSKTEGGKAGIGVGVAIALSSPDAEAYIPDDSKLNSAASIILSATAGTDTISDQDYNAKAIAGASKSSVDIAAAIANANSYPTAYAHLASSTDLNVAGDITIIANNHAKTYADAEGSTSGSQTAGVGGAVAIVNANPDTRAYIDSTNLVQADNIEITAGAGLDGSDYNDIAEAYATTTAGSSGAKADGMAGKGAGEEAKDGDEDKDKASGGIGTIQVAGAVSLAKVLPTSYAYINTGANIDASGELVINSDALTKYNSNANATNVGAEVGIGSAVAIGIANPDSQAYIDDNLKLKVANGIEIKAVAETDVANVGSSDDNVNNNNANADGGSSSAEISIGGAVANANSTPNAYAYIGSNVDTQGQSINGDIKLTAINSAKSYGRAKSNAQGSNLGVGAGIAIVNANSDTQAFIKKDTAITNTGNIELTASSGDPNKNIADARSESIASAGGASLIKKIGNDAINNNLSFDELKSSHDQMATGKIEAAAAVSVTNINPTSYAYIGDESNNNTSDIESTGDVIISSDAKTSYGAIVDGSAVASSVGVGIGVGVANVNPTSKAYISATNVNSTGGKITITSTASGDAQSAGNITPLHFASTAVNGVLSKSGAGAKTAGVAGSVSVALVNPKADAYIIDSINASGSKKTATAQNISLTSTATGDSNAASLGLAGGGTAGVGAAISIADNNSIANSYITGETAHIISGNLKISATTDANFGDITTYNLWAIAGAGGGDAGIAGGYAGGNFDPTSKAYIDSSEITVDDGYIDLSSTSQAKIEANADGFAVSGGAGIGAAVSVINVKPDAEAYIDSEKTVKTNKTTASNADITLTSTSDAIGNTTTIAGSGGDVSLSGSVNVVDTSNKAHSYIGNNADIDSKDNVSLSSEATSSTSNIAGALAIAASVGVGGGVITSNANPEALSYIGDNSLIKASTGDLKLDSTITATNNNNAYTGVAGFGISVFGAVNTIYTNPITKSYIGKNTTALIGNDIIISSDATTTSENKGAGGSLGEVSIGAAVNTTNINPDTESYVDEGTALASTGGEIQITSSSSSITTNESFAATGGLYGAVAGAVTTTTANPVANSYLVGSNTLSALNDIALTSTSTSNVTDKGLGASAGLVGLGGAVNTINANPVASSYIVDANITTLDNSNLSISSTSNSTASATSTAGAAGGIAAGAAVPTVTVNPDAKSYISGGNIAEAAGKKLNNIDITADITSSATATGQAGAVGFGAIGASVAHAYSNSNSNADAVNGSSAYIDSGASITNAGTIAIEAMGDNYAKASTVSGAVGGIAGAGSGSYANTFGNSKAYIDNPDTTTSIYSGNSITISASDVVYSTTDSKVGSGGIAAIGLSESTSNANTDTQAYIGDDTKVTSASGTIEITAEANKPDPDKNIGAASTAKAGGGGVASGQASKSHSYSAANAKAYIGQNAIVTMIEGDISITAEKNDYTTSNADATSVGVVAGGGSYATSQNISSSDIGTTDSLAYIDNGAVISIGDFTQPDVNAGSGSGSLNITAYSNKKYKDSNSINSTATSQSDAGGLGAGGGTSSNAFSYTKSNAYIDTGADITAKLDVNITTDAYNNVNTYSKSGASGFVAGGSADSYSQAYTHSIATINNGAEVAASHLYKNLNGDINITANANDKAYANSDSYNDAAIPTGSASSKAYSKPDAQIIIGSEDLNNFTLQTYITGDIILNADAQGSANVDSRLHQTYRILFGIPIHSNKNGHRDSSVSDNALIDIQQNAKIEAEGNINLTANSTNSSHEKINLDGIVKNNYLSDIGVTINSDGSITQDDNFASIVSGEIVLQNLQSIDVPGAIRLNASNIGSDHQTGEIDIHNGYGVIDITNNSDMTMNVHNLYISAVFDDGSSVYINGEHTSGSYKGITISGTQPTEEPDITIHSTTDADVIFKGSISSKSGKVEIKANGGVDFLSGQTNIEGDEIIVTNYDSLDNYHLNFEGGAITANKSLILNAGNYGSTGLIFVPDSVTAKTLTSDFIETLNPMGLNSNKTIKIGNLAKVTIDGIVLDPVSLSITSGEDAILTGENQIAGQLSLVGADSAYIDDNSIVNTTGNTTITSSNGNAYIGKTANITASSINITSNSADSYIDDGSIITVTGATSIQSENQFFLGENTKITSGSINITNNTNNQLLFKQNSEASTTNDFIITSLSGSTIFEANSNLTSQGLLNIQSNNISNTSGTLIAEDLIINPTGKLEILSSTIEGTNSLSINKGDVANQGILFNPTSVKTLNLISDYLSYKGPLNLTSTAGDIEIGNLDKVLVDGNILNPGYININSINNNSILTGDITASGYIKLDAGQAAFVRPDSNIESTNDSFELLSHNNDAYIGERSHIIANEEIIINSKNHSYIDSDSVLRSNSSYISIFSTDDTTINPDIKIFASQNIELTALNGTLQTFEDVDLIAGENLILSGKEISISENNETLLQVVNSEDFYNGSYFASRNIEILPTEYLSLKGVELVANENLTIHSGDLNNNGLIFVPDSIETTTLTSDFIAVNSLINLSSTKTVEIGNLDHISVDSKALNISGITIDSDETAQLTGDITVNGDINLSGKLVSLINDSSFTTVKNSSRNDNSSSTITANNITLTPDVSGGKLEIKGVQIFAIQSLSMYKGDLNNQGLTLNPDLIETKSLNSDFLTPNSDLTLNSNASISIGNLDHITINELALNPQNITISSLNGTASLNGDVSTVKNISLTGKNVEVTGTQENNISAYNITLNPTNMLDISGGNIKANNKLVLNAGDYANNGLVLSANSIKTQQLESDFINPDNDLNLTSTENITLGNLDEIIIAGKKLNLTNITLESSANDVQLSGNITTSGDISLTGGVVSLIGTSNNSAISANNLTISPTDTFEITNGNINVTDTFTINDFDLTNHGFILNPYWIKTSTLVSNLFQQDTTLTAVSNSNITLGNIGHIQIDNKTYNPQYVNITANNVYLKGDIPIFEDINVQANSIYLDETSKVYGNNITLNPTNYLSIDNSSIFAGGTLIINSGNILNNGIEFSPESIQASEIQSDFLTITNETSDLVTFAPLNLTSQSNLTIGNMDFVTIIGKQSSIGDITLNSINGNTSLLGDVHSVGDISLTGLQVEIKGTASSVIATNSSHISAINANNIFINPEYALFVNGGSLIANDKLVLNSGDINKNGIVFAPSLITANQLDSDFLVLGQDLDISSQRSVTIGNLDRITVDNESFSPVNVSISSGDNATLSGDNTISGNISIHGYSVSLTGSNSNISANNIVVNPDYHLNINGVNLYADSQITLNGGDILNSGLEFNPASIKTTSLNSNFLVQNGNLDIKTHSNIDISNIDQIIIDGNKIIVDDLSLEASNSITLGGQISTSGNIIISSTYKTDIAENTYLTGNSDVNISAINGIVNIVNDLTLDALGTLSIDANKIILGDSNSTNNNLNITANNLNITPTKKLEMNGGIYNAINNISISAGNIEDNGLIFNPYSIDASSLTANDIISSNSIDLTSNSSIIIGNTANIQVAGSQFVINNITLTANNSSVSLVGEVKANNNISLSGLDVSLLANDGEISTIQGANISINPTNLLTVDNSKIIASGNLQINSGDLTNAGLEFNPYSIKAHSLTSDFLSQTDKLELISNNNIKVGNLDNILINNNQLIYKEIILTSNNGDVILSGNITTSPLEDPNITSSITLSGTNISVLANDKSLYGTDSFIKSYEISINPTAKLVLTDTNIEAHESIFIGTGNYNNYGLEFAPGSIKTANLSSNIINNQAPIVINSQESIILGNLDNIEVNGNPLDIISVSLNSNKTSTISGNITAKGYTDPDDSSKNRPAQISLLGNSNQIYQNSNITADEIILDPYYQLKIIGGNITANEKLTMYKGDIENAGMVFNPESIDAKALESNFLYPDSDLDIDTKASITLGNLDNISINGSSLIIDDININADGFVALTGDISNNGSINVSTNEFYLNQSCNINIADSINVQSNYISFDLVSQDSNFNAQNQIILSKRNRGNINIGANGNFSLANFSSFSNSDLVIGNHADTNSLTNNITFYDNLLTGNSNVTIIAIGNISDFFAQDNTEIRAKNLTLNSELGSIGSPVEDLNINLTSSILNASAPGIINIKELSGDIELGLIESLSNSIILVNENGSILDGTVDDNANIIGNALYIKANNGSIGTSSNDIAVNLRNLELEAYADGVINITQQGDGLELKTITSTNNDVILRSLNGDISNVNKMINARNLSIMADQGSIGSSASPLNVNLSNSISNATAKNLINIEQFGGNLYLDTINSLTNSVSLVNDSGSILDGTATSNVNITGNSLFIKASNDSIGTAADDILVNLRNRKLKAYADGIINITQQGDGLELDNITSVSSNVILKAENGNIITNNSKKITATNLDITASKGSIGNSSNYLQAYLSGTLDAYAKNDVFITENTSDLNANNLTGVNGSIFINTPNGNSFINNVNAAKLISVNTGKKTIDINNSKSESMKLVSNQKGGYTNVSDGLASNEVYVRGENITLDFENTSSNNPLHFNISGISDNKTNDVFINVLSTKGTTFDYLNTGNVQIKNLSANTSLEMHNSTSSGEVKLNSDYVTAVDAINFNHLSAHGQSKDAIKSINLINITDLTVDKLNANTANISSKDNYLGLLNAIINRTARFKNKYIVADVNNTKYISNTDADILLTTGAGNPFKLILDGKFVLSDQIIFELSQKALNELVIDSEGFTGDTSKTPSIPALLSYVDSYSNKMLENPTDPEFVHFESEILNLLLENETFVQLLTPEMYLDENYEQITFMILEKALTAYLAAININDNDEKALFEATRILKSSNLTTETAKRLLDDERFNSNENFVKILQFLLNEQNISQGII